jgi:hypothetical protein
MKRRSVMHHIKKIFFQFVILFYCITSSYYTYTISSDFIDQDMPISSLEVCNCEICQELQAMHPSQAELQIKRKKTITKKPWTLMVYMAADNDLRSFASRNIQQMAEIGSTFNINIVIHLDIRLGGNQKVTRRYFIVEQNTIIHMNAEDPSSQSMDSGDPKTLISFVDWAANNYPADNYWLILWNHGSGTLDPERHRIINPAVLFTFNPVTHMLDLDRSIGFLELIESAFRGLCWDDTTKNYLTNQKLNDALNYICTNIIKKKLSIIGMDACLMAMIEVAKNMKNYADFMVASQEVELGAGWNYKTALLPFINNNPTPISLAKHLVAAYEQTYVTITYDYTLSAIDLNQIEKLEQNINQVSAVLLSCLAYQNNGSVKSAVRKSAHPQYCTHFEEPTYVDLYDFYTNLEKNLALIDLKKNKTSSFVLQLKSLLATGKDLIKKAVLANVTGRNLTKAQGISIYFPGKAIHNSYKKTTFYDQNHWGPLMTECLKP